MSRTVLIDSPNISAPFEDFYSEIFRYALSLMHDPAEAENVAQETFLRAYRRLDPLPDSGSLMAWLYRIATRIYLDRIRKQGYSTDDEEVEMGASCVAVPLFNGHAQAKYAISVSGPTHRIRAQQKTIIRELTRVCAEISQKLEP